MSFQTSRSSPPRPTLLIHRDHLQGPDNYSSMSSSTSTSRNSFSLPTGLEAHDPSSLFPAAPTFSSDSSPICGDTHTTSSAPRPEGCPMPHSHLSWNWESLSHDARWQWNLPTNLDLKSMYTHVSPIPVMVRTGFHLSTTATPEGVVVVAVAVAAVAA